MKMFFFLSQRLLVVPVIQYMRTELFIYENTLASSTIAVIVCVCSYNVKAMVAMVIK